jgi:hypothetical protein
MGSEAIGAADCFYLSEAAKTPCVTACVTLNHGPISTQRALGVINL